MTKILYINTVPMIFDGISMTLLNYAKNMDTKDVQLGFVTINKLEPEMENEILKLNGNIHELNSRNTNPIKYVMSLAKLIRKEKYEVVHIHGNSATMAVDLMGAFLGGAKIRAPHSHNTTCSHLRAHRFLKPLFNILYTDGFACGVDAGEWLYGKRKFKVLNNATDTSKYSFSNANRIKYRKEYNLEGKVAIGHVAHFTFHKNHSFLINSFEKAIKTNPDLVLFLIGDGKYKKEIEDMVNEKNLSGSVVFTGRLLDIPGILSAMDSMVLPSLWEGLPNVVIEWQAAGLPCVLSTEITEECKLTESVSFLELNEDSWANALSSQIEEDIKKRENTSFVNRQQISDKGYDIKRNAIQLKNYYWERLNK